MNNATRVDQDDTIHVSAQNVRTGSFKQMTLVGTVGLDEAEIESMIREIVARYAIEVIPYTATVGLARTSHSSIPEGCTR